MDGHLGQASMSDGCVFMPIKSHRQCYVLQKSVEHLTGKIFDGPQSTTEFGRERGDEGRCLCPPYSRNTKEERYRQERWSTVSGPSSSPAVSTSF
jgi:hypothetical protein